MTKLAAGPCEAALQEVWRDARKRLYTWRSLPTWLRLNRRFTLRLVDERKVKVRVPVGLVPDCENCLDLCCAGPNALVSLRLLDIARLVDAGLEAYIAPRSADPGVVEKPSSARKRLEASVFAQMFPVLARDDTQTCRLLTPSRLCGAHPAWPLSCRRYPYAFDAENDVVFLATGCDSHRMVTLDDAPDIIRDLIRTSVATYNERVKDIILLHTALQEVWGLGLLRYLELDRRLAKDAMRWGPSPSPPAADAPQKTLAQRDRGSGRTLPVVD